jgi:hypothetical protein
MTPDIFGTFYDVLTGETITRPLTDKEYEALLATGFKHDGETEE